MAIPEVDRAIEIDVDNQTVSFWWFLYGWMEGSGGECKKELIAAALSFLRTHDKDHPEYFKKSIHYESFVAEGRIKPGNHMEVSDGTENPTEET